MKNKSFSKKNSNNNTNNNNNDINIKYLNKEAYISTGK